MEDCRNKRKDDCCKDCKKEKCDCCCVPGIKEQLVEGRRVAIFVDNSFLGLPIAGRVEDVDCDTVLLSPISGPIPDIVGGLSPLPVRVSARFSLCDISAVFRLGC